MTKKKPSPRPGTPTRSSRTGRPIMVALDLLGRRWMLRVLWELHAGPHTFRALQAACDGPSPTVLSTRLRELREAGLVTTIEAQGYALTDLGHALIKALAPLNAWSTRWAKLTSPST